jgi:hypothetical protein
VKRTLSDTETARVHELLVQRATEGLDERARAELRELDPASEADQDFELAAAAVDLASLPDEALPPQVADRVLAAALAQPAFRAAAAATAPAVPAVAATLPEPSARSLRPRRAARPEAGPRLPARTLAVGFAAAAALLLAFGAGTRFARSPRDPAAGRSELLTDLSAAHRAWATPAGAAVRGVSGEVVWDGAGQRGVLRFVGLPRNDPATARYQLWIFDRARDPRFPVDGGMFDVTTDPEAVVAFAARLPVAEPVRFMVTLERPGGAVVSARDRVVVVAE